MVNNNESGSSAGGSNPIPPPQPPPSPNSAGTKRPNTPVKPKTKSSVCPVCKKNLFHEKALNGHIRWHTAEEREAAGLGVARALASAVVVVEPTVTTEEQDSAKRPKIPDLNRSPPPEDDEA